MKTNQRLSRRQSRAQGRPGPAWDTGTGTAAAAAAAIGAARRRTEIRSPGRSVTSPVEVTSRRAVLGPGALDTFGVCSHGPGGRDSVAVAPAASQGTRPPPLQLGHGRHGRSHGTRPPSRPDPKPCKPNRRDTVAVAVTAPARPASSTPPLRRRDTHTDPDPMCR